METDYAIACIRATLAFDEVCLSAAIVRGKSKIGTFGECPDTGKVITTFASSHERFRFDAFVERWWQEADYESLCSPQLRALIKQDASHALPVNEKIRCWVKHMAGPVEKSSGWKWQTRTAKQLLRSF